MNALLSPLSVAPPESAPVAALKAEGLGKAYGPITVLADVTLNIDAGEVHAIIGENGAGKSTLMKLLSGHVAPTAGDLLMEGHPVEFRNAVEAEAAGIVLVHQEILLALDGSASSIRLRSRMRRWWRRAVRSPTACPTSRQR